ncbi:hypothetical protein U5B43_10140 [Campylobacter sp. 9BO]|uniref:hypothetical protein n=1 Tax=Campylobacter sp. 9BO TaxID=3424759 RepID=UPI003D331F03
MKVRLKPNITNTDLNQDSIYNVLCIEIGDKIEFYLQKYFNYGDIYLAYPYLSDLLDIVDNDIKNWSIEMFEKNIYSNANFDEIKQIKYINCTKRNQL